jgi:hypothetical protein
MLATLCAEALKRREEKKRERLRRSARSELCNPFAKYNKDKVPMDVATSLVVNHVNLGVLCLFMLCLCLCLWRSCSSRRIHINIKNSRLQSVFYA